MSDKVRWIFNAIWSARCGRLSHLRQNRDNKVKIANTSEVRHRLMLASRDRS